LRESGAVDHALTEADDFMEMPAAGEFDRVLMNPPFEKQQDIDHVRRAFDHLKPGGRLSSGQTAYSLRTRVSSHLDLTSGAPSPARNFDGRASHLYVVDHGEVTVHRPYTIRCDVAIP
jgi:hypothetical protein